MCEVKVSSKADFLKTLTHNHVCFSLLLAAARALGIP